MKKAYTPKKAKNEDSRPIVTEALPRNIIPVTPKAGSSTHNDSTLIKESFDQSSSTLTKRACYRRRQRHARQLAKALEQTDGVRYYADLESRKHQVVQSPQRQITHISAKFIVKRARSTLKERIQKRMANTARAHALLQQRREGKKKTVSKEAPKNHKVWIPKSKLVRKLGLQNTTFDRGSLHCRGASFNRDSLRCRGKLFDRNTKHCRGQKKFHKSTPSTPSTSVPSPSTVSTPAVSPVKPWVSPDLSKSKIIMADVLDPLPEDRGKAPVKERLGTVNEPQIDSYTGGRKYPPIKSKQLQDGKTLISTHLGVRNETQEPVKTMHLQGHVSKHATPDVTLDRSNATTSCPENANKALHPQKKTCSSKDIVIPGGSYQQTIGFSDNHTDELYYQDGGVNKTRKRIVREMSSHCCCMRLIRAVLSECDYSKREAIPQRVSMVQRLFTKMLKPKLRHFCKKLAVQEDEFPEVTINMIDKRKSKQHSGDSDPDFSPTGRVNSRIAQRMSRL